jgi:glycerol kinase
MGFPTLPVRNDIKYLEEELLFSINRFFSIPEHILPEIKPSATIYGYINKGALQGIPVGAV